MAWRFIEPNKPIRASDDFLDDIDNKYIIDAKLDGWRTEIVKQNGELLFLSRRNRLHEVPKEIKTCFQFMPEGMALDTEWINRTKIKSINTNLSINLPLVDNIVVFDVRWVNGRYIASTPLADRRAIDFYRNLPTIDLANLLSHDMKVFQAISCKGGEARDFYHMQTDYAISEGIVVKRSDGGLSGNWYKVKYRE